MNYEAEGLLDGLEGDRRKARLELLEHLSDDGFTAEELRRAVKENRLALLPVDRMLGGSHTAAEIEQETGLPTRLMLRIRRLQGLAEANPDDRVFSDEDIEAARSTKLFLEAGFDEQSIVELTRVLGEGMARLTATITAEFANAFLAAGDSEEQVAPRFAQLAEQLTPAFGPVLLASFKAHLRDSVRRGMLGQAELESGDIASSQELSVCFADLVGFTRLGSQVELRELGSVAGRLAELATSVTEPPVRLVKTIGDAAMFVSPEPGPLVGVALRLVAEVEAAELPSLRAGIAVGPALLRAGDYYGNSVNLASRVTGVARPGTVLCTKEVHDAAQGEYDWSSAGRHRLKGVSGPTPLFRARLHGERDGDDGAKTPRGGRSRKRARR